MHTRARHDRGRKETKREANPPPLACSAEQDRSSSSGRRSERDELSRRGGTRETDACRETKGEDDAALTRLEILPATRCHVNFFSVVAFANYSTPLRRKIASRNATVRELASFWTQPNDVTCTPKLNPSGRSFVSRHACKLHKTRLLPGS